MTIPAEVVATGFELPSGYRRACRLGLKDLEPWRFLRGEAFLSAYASINEVQSERILVPFAYRCDCGELACFEVLPTPSETVCIYQPGPMGLKPAAEFPGFWNWFRAAIDDLIRAEPSAPLLAEVPSAMTWEWFQRRAGETPSTCAQLPRVPSS